jgi:hypothetical protein
MISLAKLHNYLLVIFLEPISKMSLGVQCLVADRLKMYSSSARARWRTLLFRMLHIDACGVPRLALNPNPLFLR